MNVGEPLRLPCEAVASPEPTIEWFHDGEKIELVEARHMRFLQNGRMLQIVAAKVRPARRSQ